MIFYPLSVLMLAGIRNILIIVNKGQLNQFRKILPEKNNLGIKVFMAKLIDVNVVNLIMENENITNHFEWAIMLLKHQFDKDPYSLTTDQIEVLKLHHQIEIDNEVEE